MSRIKKSVSFVLALLMLISVLSVASISANAETITSGEYAYELNN